MHRGFGDLREGVEHTTGDRGRTTGPVSKQALEHARGPAVRGAIGLVVELGT